MVAEHDTTHWCQNGRPAQELASDQTEDRHLVKRLQRAGSTWRPGERVSRTKLEEASTDGSAHSTQGRFPGMTISDELLQKIEKMSEKSEDHHHSASMTQMEERKHRKSNKVRIKPASLPTPSDVR